MGSPNTPATALAKEDKKSFLSRYQTGLDRMERFCRKVNRAVRSFLVWFYTSTQRDTYQEALEILRRSAGLTTITATQAAELLWAFSFLLNHQHLYGRPEEIQAAFEMAAPALKKSIQH